MNPYDQTQNPNKNIGASLSEIDAVIGFYEKPYARWTRKRGVRLDDLQALVARDL